MFTLWRLGRFLLNDAVGYNVAFFRPVHVEKLNARLLFLERNWRRIPLHHFELTNAYFVLLINVN